MGEIEREIEQLQGQGILMWCDEPVEHLDLENKSHCDNLWHLFSPIQCSWHCSNESSRRFNAAGIAAMNRRAAGIAAMNRREQPTDAMNSRRFIAAMQLSSFHNPPATLRLLGEKNLRVVIRWEGRLLPSQSVYPIPFGLFGEKNLRVVIRWEGRPLGRLLPVLRGKTVGGDAVLFGQNREDGLVMTMR